MKSPANFALAALLASSLPTLAQTAPATHSPATATKPAEVGDPAHRAALEPILKQLSAREFAARTAAQKKLADFGDEFAPALREALAQASDDETKQRLSQALAAIADRQALNLPPISLNLTDATPADIAAALTAATGKTIESSVAPGAAVKNVTLKIDKKSFWEALAAVNAQVPLDVADTAYDRRFLLSVKKDNLNVYKSASFQGTFAFVPLALSRGDAVAFGDGKALPRNFTLTLRVAADPRLRVLRQSGVAFSEIVDDAGNSLLLDSGNPSLTTFRGPVYTTAFNLNYPEKPGKKVTSIKGEIRFVVLVAAETLDIPDLSKLENKPIELAGYKITLTEAKVTGGIPSVFFSTETPEGKAPPRPPVAAAGPRDDPVLPEFEVRDSKGRFVTNLRVSGGGGGMKWGGDPAFVEPLKGRFLVPTRVKEITVPFQFKDLPMP